MHSTIYEDSLNSVRRFMASVHGASRSISVLEIWKKCVSAIIVDALYDFYYPYKCDDENSSETQKGLSKLLNGAVFLKFMLRIS